MRIDEIQKAHTEANMNYKQKLRLNIQRLKHCANSFTSRNKMFRRCDWRSIDVKGLTAAGRSKSCLFDLPSTIRCTVAKQEIKNNAAFKKLWQKSIYITLRSLGDATDACELEWRLDSLCVSRSDEDGCGFKGHRQEVEADTVCIVLALLTGCDLSLPDSWRSSGLSLPAFSWRQWLAWCIVEANRDYEPEEWLVPTWHLAYNGELRCYTWRCDTLPDDCTALKPRWAAQLQTLHRLWTDTQPFDDMR